MLIYHSLFLKYLRLIAGITAFRKKHNCLISFMTVILVNIYIYIILLFLLVKYLLKIIVLLYDL